MKVSGNLNALSNYNHELKLDKLTKKLPQGLKKRLSTNLSTIKQGKETAINVYPVGKQILATSNSDGYKETVEKDADTLNLTGKDRDNYISTGSLLKQKENSFIGLLFDSPPPATDQYVNFNKLVSDLSDSEQSQFLSAASNSGNNINELVKQTNDLEGTERTQFLSAAELAGDNVNQLIKIVGKLSENERQEFLSQAAGQSSKEDLVSLIDSKKNELVQKNSVANGVTIGNVKITDIAYSEGDDGSITATGKADLSAYGLGSSVDVDLETNDNYQITSASTRNAINFNLGGDISDNNISGGINIQGTAEINYKGLSINGNASFNAFGQQVTISEGNFSISQGANNKTTVSFSGGTLNGLGVNTSVNGSITSDGTLNGTSLMLSTSSSVATDLIPGFDQLQKALSKVGLNVDTELSSTTIVFNPGQDNFSVKTDGFTFDISKSDDGTKTIDITKNINNDDGTLTRFTAKMIDGTYFDENANKNVTGQYFEASLKSGIDTDFIPGFNEMKSALSNLGINLDTDSVDAFVSFDLERDVYSLSYNGMRFESFTNEKNERMVSFGGFSFGAGVTLELSDVTYNADTNAISATVNGGIGFGVGDYGIGIDLAQADFSYDPDSGEFSLSQRQTLAGFGVTTSLSLDLSDIMKGKINITNVSVTPETNTQFVSDIAKGLENALEIGGDVANNFKKTLNDLNSTSRENFAKAAAAAGDSIDDLVSYTQDISDDIKDDFLKAASKAGNDLDNLVANAKKLSGNSLKNFVKKAASSQDLNQFLNKFGSVYSKVSKLSSQFSNIEVTSSGAVTATFQVPGAASTTLSFDENNNGDLTATGSLKLGGHTFSNASFSFSKSGALKSASGSISLKVWGVGTSASLELSGGNVRAKGSFHYGFGSLSFSVDRKGIHIA